MRQNMQSNNSGQAYAAEPGCGVRRGRANPGAPAPCTDNTVIAEALP